MNKPEFTSTKEIFPAWINPEGPEKLANLIDANPRLMELTKEYYEACTESCIEPDFLAWNLITDYDDAINTNLPLPFTEELYTQLSEIANTYFSMEDEEEPDPLTSLLRKMDQDLEETKDLLIKTLGADPGHDIGDADSALEILSNTITEWDEEDTQEFIDLLQGIYTSHNIKDIYNQLTLFIGTDGWMNLHKELYDHEPYSGFGPA